MQIALSEPDLKESSNSKMITPAIEAIQQPQITDQKATYKSKSKPKPEKVKAPSKKLDRDVCFDSELQVQTVLTNSSLQEDSSEDKAVSAIEEESKNLGFQSKGSIGLPKRKSRLR